MSKLKSADRYDEAFFSNISDHAGKSARAVIPLLKEMLPIQSVLDVGCGAGTWLKAFTDLGVQDVFGLDGDYVNPTSLDIPREKFLPTDLTRPFTTARRFDLTLCLEVGEHLPVSSAAGLVRSLCNSADAVLFSAAIPHQQGTRHINTQWPAYWARLFGENGYGWSDFIRPAFWENEQVSWWYAQNALLYVRLSAADRYPKVADLIDGKRISPKSIVHPGCYEVANDRLAALHEFRAVPTIVWSAKALTHSLFSSLGMTLTSRSVCSQQPRATEGSVA